MKKQKSPEKPPQKVEKKKSKTKWLIPTFLAIGLSAGTIREYHKLIESAKLAGRLEVDPKTLDEILRNYQKKIYDEDSEGYELTKSNIEQVKEKRIQAAEARIKKYKEIAKDAERLAEEQPDTTKASKWFTIAAYAHKSAGYQRIDANETRTLRPSGHGSFTSDLISGSEVLSEAGYYSNLKKAFYLNPADEIACINYINYKKKLLFYKYTHEDSRGFRDMRPFYIHKGDYPNNEQLELLALYELTIKNLKEKLKRASRKMDSSELTPTYIIHEDNGEEKEVALSDLIENLEHNEDFYVVGVENIANRSLLKDKIVEIQKSIFRFKREFLENIKSKQGQERAIKTQRAKERAGKG